MGEEGLQVATAPIARLAGMAWGGSGRTDAGPSVQMWPAKERRDQLSRPPLQSLSGSEFLTSSLMIKVA